jgi:hypothetical protein
MKKIFFGLSLFISINSFADVLHNYDEVKTAVINGQTIHIAIDFSQCTTNRLNLTAPSNIGVFTPDTMQVADNYIATSFNHFTLNNPGFAGMPIYEFVTYTIIDKNYVKLTSQPLDATSYKPLADKVAFICQIDAGAKFYTY